mgnify:CR=1 FL=1
MHIVFKVKNNIWKTPWKGKTLYVIPVENDYNIIHGSKVLHKEVNVIELRYLLEDLTGKTPLFTTEKNKSILYH